MLKLHFAPNSRAGRIVWLFEDCFDRAQRSGDYAEERSARDLAAHVMVMNQGLRVASRKRVPRSELKRQVDTALSLLGLSVPA